MVTEEEIKQAIDNLGPTTEKVVESLTNKHITGERQISSTCPVARYLNKLFDAHVIDVNDDTIEVEDKVIITPDHIQEFIRNFDAGNYPQLIKKDLHPKDEADSWTSRQI